MLAPTNDITLSNIYHTHFATQNKSFGAICSLLQVTITIIY